MNIQNLADTLNTLAAARKFGVRAVADYGKEGTDEGIKFVTLSGSWIYTITRGGLDSTAFAASAERNINEIGDRISAADVAGSDPVDDLTKTLQSAEPATVREAVRGHFSAHELLNIAFETFFRGTPREQWNDDQTALVARTNEDRVKAAAVALIESFTGRISLPAYDIAKALDADKDPGDDFEPWNPTKY